MIEPRCYEVFCEVSELDAFSEATWAMENKHEIWDFKCEEYPKVRVIEESCKWIREV
jgi:hypothetical protein